MAYDYVKLYDQLRPLFAYDPNDFFNRMYIGQTLLNHNINQTSLNTIRFDLITQLEQYSKNHQTGFLNYDIKAERKQWHDYELKNRFYNDFEEFCTNEINFTFFTDREDTQLKVNDNIDRLNESTYGIYIPKEEIDQYQDTFKTITILSYLYTIIRSFNHAKKYSGKQETLFAQLTFYQSQENGTNFQDIQPHSAATPFQRSLIEAIGDNNESSPEITTWELIELIDRLKQQIIPTTNESRWLLKNGSNNSQFATDILQQFTKINQLSPVKLTDTPKNVQQMITNVIEQGYQVNIWKLPKTFTPDINHQKSVWGIHGTSALSVPSIIENGLQDHLSLIKENNRFFNETGQALGNGVYFARLSQYEKAFNYRSSNSNTSYAFISKLHYDHDLHVKSYSIDTFSPAYLNSDLVVGDRVGSYDRDELVIKDYHQAEPQYMLEIKN